MRVSDIRSLEEYVASVRAQGFDGFYCPDEPCGCSLDNPAPCGIPFDTDDGWRDWCKPAYRFTCIGAQECAHPCDIAADPGGDCFCVAAGGPKRKVPA